MLTPYRLPGAGRDQVIYEIRTMEELADGVLAYVTSRRIPEFGVRMALGAARVLARLVAGIRPAEPFTIAGMLLVLAGKGIAAALLMANLQANLRSQCAVALEDPARMLRSVNRLLFENTGESAYATLFFAEFEDRTRRLRFANCGHLPALILRRDGSVERLDSTCTVVGLFAAWDCAIEERQLSPGDMLALYTDGVTESFNEQGDEYGEQRLAETLLKHRGRSARDAIASVVADLRGFSPCEQHDDITLIVAHCR